MKIFSENSEPIFQTVRQPLLESEYVRIIADRFSITEEVATAQLFHQKQGRPESGRRQFRSVNYPKPPQIECLEEKVLRLMIRYPELAECVRESEALGCFEESRLSAMAGVLCQAGFCSREDYNSSSVYDLLRESDLQELYARYLLEPYELEEPEIQLRHWLEALIKRRAKKRKKELQLSLQEAERKGDLAQIQNLLMEIKNLTAKTNAVDFSDNV